MKSKWFATERHFVINALSSFSKGSFVHSLSFLISGWGWDVMLCWVAAWLYAFYMYSRCSIRDRAFEVQSVCLNQKNEITFMVYDYSFSYCLFFIFHFHSQFYMPFSGFLARLQNSSKIFNDFPILRSFFLCCFL